jgi:hypothetical protein
MIVRTTFARAAWLIPLFTIAWIAGAAATAGAQTLTLSLSRTTIPFASADPDNTAFVAAPVVTVTYRVRNNWLGNWQITLLSSGNLSGTAGTIPVSAVTWTATPAPPFQAGTMSTTVAQRLASGSGNVDPSRQGQVWFLFANSWDYNVGTYSATFTFTLIAP